MALSVNTGNANGTTGIPESAASAHFDALKEGLENKSISICVIGLGYVGLPLVQTLHDAGFPVVGYDKDGMKVKALREGRTYIRHFAREAAAKLAQSDRFIATDRFADLSNCQVFIMCLPTPVGSHNEPDISFVTSTAELLSGILKAGTLVVLESTIYPGATEGDLVSSLQKSTLELGKEFFVAYSPEREDPGNKGFKTHMIPKLLGGVDEKSGILANLLYSQGGFENTVRVSSARIAECAKLLENTYRAVNIALVNELKQVFESMDVDIWEVLEAAGTKPFGFQRFDPGPGIGGHCIPVDPLYLTWKAKETGAPCEFIELAALVNAKMPLVVVEKIQMALNSERKCVNGSSILLLGIAYKPDVDDIREAPSLVIWEKLLDLGARVSFCDPFIPSVCQTRRHGRLYQESSVDLANRHGMERFDAIALITHHTYFNKFAFLEGFTGPVIDTRNRIPRNLGLKIFMA